MAYFSRLKAGVKCYHTSRFNVQQLLLICGQYISRYAGFLSVGADRIISTLHLTGVKVSVLEWALFSAGTEGNQYCLRKWLCNGAVVFHRLTGIKPCEMNPPHFDALTATRSSEAGLPLGAHPGIFGGAGGMACRKALPPKRQESLFMGASFRRSGRS